MKKTIKGILEDTFIINTVRPLIDYCRTQDDCEGDLSQKLHVSMGPDGDMWISMGNNVKTWYRFRVPCTGGGRSPRTRNALMILAEAIRLDNENE